MAAPKCEIKAERWRRFEFVMTRILSGGRPRMDVGRTNAAPSPVSGVALNDGTWFLSVSVISPLPWRRNDKSSNPSIGVGDFMAVLPAARVPVTKTSAPANALVAREKSA